MFQWLEPVHLLYISVLSILLIVFLFELDRSRTKKLNLPPSPSRFPVIGNLHQLGSLPHRSLQSLARKHGPVMLIHLGQTPSLVVSSADAATEILKTQDHIFSNRPRLIFQARLSFSNKDIAFSSGEYWRQVRKISVLQLLSPQRVKSYRSIREEEVEFLIKSIRESCSYGSSTVNWSEMILSYTNSVICRVTLGRKYGGDEGGRKFWKMVTEYMYFVGVFNVEDYIPWLAWVNNLNGFNTRMEKNFKDLDCFLESVIQEHIQSGGNGVEDFVDVLLGIQKDSSIGFPFAKDNIKAIVMDIFAAGSDSSATTVVWAMTELIRHPDILREVQDEIREIGKEKQYITEDDLGQLHYLKMVIKETLRLHAPPFLVPHESSECTRLHGYNIPAKTRVLVNVWAIARDPISWEEPEEFRPRRFLNTSADLRGQEGGFLPFGAGRRGCPGILFATTNMELPLANLLYHFDWTSPGGKYVDVTEGSGVVAYKKNPLILDATPCSFC